MKLIIKVVAVSLIVLIAIISLLFGHRDIPLEDLKAKYAPAPSQFIGIDGMDVHFRDEGPSSDSIPLVLIHGTGASLHTYEPWVQTLKEKRRVLRMDLPAFGLTGPLPSRDYSLSNYVRFIKNFLDAKGITKCHLAGNSLGGLIAWGFTAEHPEMVEKLILIDAAGYPMKSKSVPIAFKIAQTPLLNKVMTFITPRFMVKSSVENVYADKSLINDALLDRYFELTLRAGNRQALVDRMTMVIDSIPIDRVKNIQQSTLVLWGAKDYLIPVSEASRFHEDLPNDTLVILPSAGHVPMEEQPEESLAALMSFLDKD
ncbi:MAG: pimeloyl-ACP methyl ester carboxylesterase [Arcticibacterium sp.]|jgi:pimeloyl-ACP methyl ester carboxylesterase